MFTILLIFIFGTNYTLYKLNIETIIVVVVVVYGGSGSGSGSGSGENGTK
ncbi:hypothetical protein PIROE2DRAFT_8929 [Piromyces sp. E2]|nr:hypothetical protein PIROE2DRAFT_8929 [Piromyces sp. E2]|eukprot:OUM64309.1 hypothetical protein PIROE2DRAFT_8929 [Piromyces sp. E2]